ncbi:hypothetical protein HBZS_118980 [Helicobacter bizzozeronii CCUG 35545]|nr:hypothetical protein HBZS_118980 [Helicobacter bizzozeronii CCUG 35545]
MFDDALLSIFDRMPLIASFLAGILAFFKPLCVALAPCLYVLHLPKFPR